MSIDTHIPAPAHRRAPMYPFKSMAVGESVFYPHEGSIVRCKPYLAAHTVTKRDKTRVFAGRSVIEQNVPGVRIWRVA